MKKDSQSKFYYSFSEIKHVGSFLTYNTSHLALLASLLHNIMKQGFYNASQCTTEGIPISSLMVNSY